MNEFFVVDFQVYDKDMKKIQSYSTSVSADCVNWLMEQVDNLVTSFKNKKQTFSKCYVNIYRRNEEHLELMMKLVNHSYSSEYNFV